MILKFTALTTLIAFCLPLAGAAPSSNAKRDEIVNGIEGFYKKVEDFTASFAQEVRRAHLPRPLKRSGKVYFKAPGKMRWDYLQPDRVYYVSDGDTLWSYEHATKQAIKTSIKDSELYDSLKFLFGQGALSESFDITLTDAPEGRAALLLVPKKGQQNYKSLTLLVDPKTYEVKETRLVDPLDNISTITFSEQKYDPLKDEGFSFTPPKGAAIQDLTKLRGTKGTDP